MNAFKTKQLKTALRRKCHDVADKFNEEIEFIGKTICRIVDHFILY